MYNEMWKKGGHVVDSQSSEKQLEKVKQRQSEQKIVKKIVLITTAIIIALVLIVGVGGYFYVQGMLKLKYQLGHQLIQSPQH